MSNKEILNKLKKLNKYYEKNKRLEKDSDVEFVLDLYQNMFPSKNNGDDIHENMSMFDYTTTITKKIEKGNLIIIASNKWVLINHINHLIFRYKHLLIKYDTQIQKEELRKMSKEQLINKVMIQKTRS